MIITILAYKSDSEDVCRGCHMASYSSDFQFRSSMDRTEVAEFLAGLMFANKHLDTNEGGYEFTWLFNGEENPDWELATVRSDIEFVAGKRVEQLEADFQRKEAESKQRAANKQKRETEERERQQLAQLQAKYAPRAMAPNEDYNGQ
jgi:hypothetical protein